MLSDAKLDVLSVIAEFNSWYGNTFPSGPGTYSGLILLGIIMYYYLTCSALHEGYLQFKFRFLLDGIENIFPVNGAFWYYIQCIECLTDVCDNWLYSISWYYILLHYLGIHWIIQYFKDVYNVLHSPSPGGPWPGWQRSWSWSWIFPHLKPCDLHFRSFVILFYSRFYSLTFSLSFSPFNFSWLTKWKAPTRRPFRMTS